MDILSDLVPPQGHAHAPGAAPAPGQLGAGHFQHPDAAVLQDLVGDIVPVVHHHHAGGDAQGVGPVVPLLPLGGDLAAAAAADQLHPVQTQIARQHLLQGAADLPGGELALSPARQLEDPQGAQDPRMHTIKAVIYATLH